MKQIATRITFILPFIAIGLLVSQIIFTNNLAQDGSTLKTMIEKGDALALENERLEQEIASQSSLLAVQKKAVEAGFIEAKQFLTLAQGKYLVAFSQKR